MGQAHSLALRSRLLGIPLPCRDARHHQPPCRCASLGPHSEQQLTALALANPKRFPPSATRLLRQYALPKLCSVACLWTLRVCVPSSKPVPPWSFFRTMAQVVKVQCQPPVQLLHRAVRVSLRHSQIDPSPRLSNRSRMCPPHAFARSSSLGRSACASGFAPATHLYLGTAPGPCPSSCSPGSIFHDLPASLAPALPPLSVRASVVVPLRMSPRPSGPPAHHIAMAPFHESH
jgi:hypothetical protein